MVNNYPTRIVCLTEETTETLYLLGEEDRIVGISGYTVRPPRARREKAKVSGFTTANIDAILELQPDLVLGFSDLQAGIAESLISRGIEVHVFNQRTVAGILRMIRMVGAMVGQSNAADQLALRLKSRLDAAEIESRNLSRRPRVYFEEWDAPMISGIQWVSELIRIAGGNECFPELAQQPLARDRIIADPLEVVRRSPDIIIGSWCGKKFRGERVASRSGWQSVPAVAGECLFEIKSPLILSPGPAALTEGLTAIQRIVGDWHERHVLNGR